MRESERLRARVREIVQGCDGTTMEWHERMSVTVADAIAALERTEARVAELERGIARFRDHGLPLVVTVICTLNGAVTEGAIVGVLVDDINELLGAEATDGA